MNRITHFFQLLLALCCLLLIVSACGQPASHAQAHSDGSFAAGGAATPQPTSTPTQTVPDTSNQTCPASGNGRAASMPALAPGKSNELIYLKQQPDPDTSTLTRYDIASQTSQPILQISTAEVKASVSPNGQWILLIGRVNGQAALQLVRADGQDLQTLYCAPAETGIEEAQLSPDQHMLAFSLINQDLSQSMLLALDLTSGQVHTVLSSQVSGYPQPQGLINDAPTTGLSLLNAHAPLNPLPSQSHLTFQPQQWINNTSLYLSGTVEGVSPGSAPQLYLLHNVNSSAAQQQSNIQLAAPMTSIQNCNSFDITPDGQNVICSIATEMGWTSPAQIQMQATSGGTTHTVYTGPNGGVTTARAIANSTLIFTLSQNSQPDSLWKINTNGSGLTQLATAPANSWMQFANSGYQPWSILSPDGMFYVIHEYNPSNGTATLLIGHFNLGSGGASRGLTISGSGLEPVGWTQYA
jgi:eukaryotic-like serine/threonine-protein kinase